MHSKNSLILLTDLFKCLLQICTLNQQLKCIFIPELFLPEFHKAPFLS